MQVLYNAVYKNRALFKSVKQDDIVQTCLMLYSWRVQTSLAEGCNYYCEFVCGFAHVKITISGMPTAYFI
jgi:hypothetical protein